MRRGKKFIWLTDKPYVHWFLHFLVTGKLVVSQSVLVNPRGDSLKELGQGYVEDIPTPQSGVWGCEQFGWQYLDVHCHAM